MIILPAYTSISYSHNVIVMIFMLDRSLVNNGRLYKHNMFDWAMFSKQFLCRGYPWLVSHIIWVCMMETVSILCLQVRMRITVSLVFTLVYLYCFWFVSAHWRLVKGVLYCTRFNSSWYSECQQICLHTISEWIIIEVYRNQSACTVVWWSHVQ